METTTFSSSHPISKRKINRRVKKKDETNKKKQLKTYNYTKTRNKKPKPRHRSEREYDFLQYIRLVIRWASNNYDLDRSEIELLLFLYPLGTFSKTDFYDYHKTIKFFQHRTLEKFIKDGFVCLWREGKPREAKLYVLTDKAKKLCARMHKFCTGEQQIPESPRYNKLSGEKNTKKRIDGYYMDAIKKMNMNRRDKDE